VVVGGSALAVVTVERERDFGVGRSGALLGPKTLNPHGSWSLLCLLAETYWRVLLGGLTKIGLNCKHCDKVATLNVVPLNSFILALNTNF